VWARFASVVPMAVLAIVCLGATCVWGDSPCCGAKCEKVVFDTDIGGDVDDLVALTYLLNKPACDLLGVTVGSVVPDLTRRAEIVSAACRATGRSEIPVHVGASLPMCGGRHPTPKAPCPRYWKVAEKRSHASFSKENTAIGFLRQTIRANPGEVTLLAVGGFTNVGLLFSLDPEIPGLLKRLVLMGGDVEGKVEWNASCDPVATAIAFQNGYQTRPKETLVVPADVTMRRNLKPELGRKYMSDRGFELCREGAEFWYRDGFDLYFHDPLAAVLLFRPEIAACTNAAVSVDVANEGRMRLTDSPRFGTLKIVRQVDWDAFDRELKSTIARLHRTRAACARGPHQGSQ